MKVFDKVRGKFIEQKYLEIKFIYEYREQFRIKDLSICDYYLDSNSFEGYSSSENDFIICKPSGILDLTSQIIYERDIIQPEGLPDKLEVFFRNARFGYIINKDFICLGEVADKVKFKIVGNKLLSIDNSCDVF